MCQIYRLAFAGYKDGTNRSTLHISKLLSMANHLTNRWTPTPEGTKQKGRRFCLCV